MKIISFTESTEYFASSTVFPLVRNFASGAVAALAGYVDGGPLANARIVEEITGLLIGLNIRYKAPEGFGFRITGLPK